MGNMNARTNRTSVNGDMHELGCGMHAIFMETLCS